MTERAFISSDLTFIHTSFAKIFCQNLVKKNRKFVSPFFPDSACAMRERRHVNILSCEPETCPTLAVVAYLLRERGLIIMVIRICYYSNTDLLLRQCAYNNIVVI